MREREVRSIVERETLKLSGLSDSNIVFDYQRLKPFGKHLNPYWVTISREFEVRKQMERLGSEDNERFFCEITNVSNALATTFLYHHPDVSRTLLVNIGSTNTIVVFLDQGQAVHAGNFPIGGESFTSAIATVEKCEFEEAEKLKRTQDFINGPLSSGPMVSVVEAWRNDLEKMIREWEEENPELRNPSHPFTVILSGGGSEQPGLIDYLRKGSKLFFQAWPDAPIEGLALPLRRFAVTYGSVLQAFKLGHQNVTLLPITERTERKRYEQIMQLNLISLVTALLLFLLLTVSLVQKGLLVHNQMKAETQTRTALLKARAIASLLERREMEYRKLKPVLEPQKLTMSIIETLQLLQANRDVFLKKGSFLALFADRRSYFAGGVDPSLVNPTNLPSSEMLTNSTNFDADFIIELSGEKRDGRYSAAEMAKELRDGKFFDAVDTLAPQNRNTNLLGSFWPPTDYSPIFIKIVDLENPTLPSAASQSRTNSKPAAPH